MQSDQVDKNDAVAVEADADERKERIREEAVARGVPPEEAAALAEEQVAAAGVGDVTPTDEFGKELAQRTISAAVAGEKTVDREVDDAQPEVEALTQTTALDEMAVTEVEDIEPAAQPSPMRKPE